MIFKRTVLCIQKIMCIGAFFVAVMVFMWSPAMGMSQVGLYDAWWAQVINSKSYNNPFNFNEINLEVTYTSPTGKKINFFGFYDGDGKGGQTGNVWKLRFMPDQIGTWSYAYSWTDGTPGGSGSFIVVDTGLPGPLKVATDNSWYFMTSRGTPFNFRGYDLHHVGPEIHTSTTWATASSTYIDIMTNKMIARGYNMAMVDSPSNSENSRSWWKNGQKDVFDLAVWRDYEKMLLHALSKGVYVFPFDGFVSQGNKNHMTSILAHYMVARFGAYASYMGFSPTWEWTDIWSASEVNQIMNEVQAFHPFASLLTIHDCSKSDFIGWLDFSMRQAASPSKPTRDIFSANSRTAGQSQGSCNTTGGVAGAFLNKPIIGSEEIWELPGGNFGEPRNKTEVRRAAWGIMMAGVMPLYSEWTKWSDNPGNMPGEPAVRRMFDFFYSKTTYREYQQLNSLVSKSSRQVASGKAGLEYLVYDENGGSITINLGGAGGTYDLLWFNPTSGATQNGGQVNGGASRTLHSPFSGDTVLLLTKGAADTTPPAAPMGLRVQ